MRRREEEFYFRRPGIDQRHYVGKREILEPDEKEFEAAPRIGLVIGTFAAVPYVHMALAVRQRLYPEVPTLVHDDCSDKQEQLLKLCNEYGAEFETNSSRLGHQMGDLSALVGGLEWAAEKGIDLLAKMSRRFVPLANWVQGLAQLAMEKQGVTFSQPCRQWSLPIRAECMAVSVKRWAEDSVLSDMKNLMLAMELPVMLEHQVMARATKAYAMRSAARRAVEIREQQCLVVEPWPLLTSNRMEASANFLWHNVSPPEMYASLATQLGLPYQAADFGGYWSQGGI